MSLYVQTAYLGLKRSIKIQKPIKIYSNILFLTDLLFFHFFILVYPLSAFNTYWCSKRFHFADGSPESYFRVNIHMCVN